LQRTATLLGTVPLLRAGLRLVGITADRRHRALNRRCALKRTRALLWAGILLRANILLWPGRLRLGDFGTNLRLRAGCP
jgi:hypothetical protein